ncbi:helix-turn-helix transcriptional regulator [Streptomyces lincolnensis]|uniref:helix-turn-helix transcriptional regulator n=1 Tax=Streptomyces lincolnensis TaxID=1915 RepID=UPI0037D1651F
MPRSSPPPVGHLWTRAAARHLGFHFTTLYRWRRDGVGPPSFRIGQRRWAYRVADLDSYLAAQHAARSPAPRAS